MFPTSSGELTGMLKSRDRSRSRGVSRPIFDGLGLGLGLEGCGLSLNVSGLGLNEHCWPRCRKCKHFYPNVTTLRSGLCYRNSVCRLSVCRLSSVTLVHPTQRVEAFGKISSPLCTLAIL